MNAKPDPFGNAVRGLLGGKNRGFPVPQPGKMTQVTAAAPNSYGIPVAGEPVAVGRAPDSFCQSLWSKLSMLEPGSPEYQRTVGEIDKYCGLPPGAKPPKQPGAGKPRPRDALCDQRRQEWLNVSPFDDQYESARKMHAVQMACGVKK